MSLYREIADLEAQGESLAFCLVTQTSGSVPRQAGSKMLVYPDGRIEGTVGGGEMESRVIAEALEALEEGLPRVVEYALTDPARGDPGVCGGQLEVYVEPIMPHPTVVVVGAGHVGQAVAHLAKWLGFRVVVSDDRQDYCSPEVVPEADAFYPGALSTLPEQLKINAQTYIVMTTRNVKVDVEGLPKLLDTPAAYIGVIGSRRRWQTARQMLLEAGVSEESADRVTSPMGLELNAETPEEIAVSILSEILMLRDRGHGKPMSA